MLHLFMRGCWYYRDAYGISPIVKMLEQSKDGSQVVAAADAIRALTLNNNTNKDAVREAWALPLLVKLLSSVSRLLQHSLWLQSHSSFHSPTAHRLQDFRSHAIEGATGVGGLCQGRHSVPKLAGPCP